MKKYIMLSTQYSLFPQLSQTKKKSLKTSAYETHYNVSGWNRGADLKALYQCP